MASYKRVTAVAVLYAAFVLIFSILQAIIPGIDFIDVWFHSLLLQLLFFGIFWFLASILIKVFEGSPKK